MNHTYAVYAELDPVSSSLMNSISRAPLQVKWSSFPASFHAGGATPGALATTFTRLFSAAIIEFEYVFARMSAAIW